MKIRIKSFVQKRVAELEKAIAALGNSSASPKVHVEAIRTLFANDPNFWAEIKRLTIPKVASKKKVVPAVEKVETQPQSNPIVSDLPAKTFEVSKPENGNGHGNAATFNIGGMMMAALNKPGVSVSLEPKTNSSDAKPEKKEKWVSIRSLVPKPAVSLMDQFRAAMKEDGHGVDYWKRCHFLTFAVLNNKLVKEEADWKLLAEKMKINLFFNARDERYLFLDQCQKEILKDLLLGSGGLWKKVEEINRETEKKDASPYRLDFTMAACIVLGEEAKDLLTKCKHVVNRMKQLNFIPENHWLAMKVAAMKVARDKKLVQTTAIVDASQAPSMPEVVEQENNAPLAIPELEAPAQVAAAA